VLLYDGLCRFCNGTVRFVLAHDRRGALRFAALQGVFARQVLSRHPEFANIDSLILIDRDAGIGTE
jgi:predicted DCC family thiol-disulfide oxidoreductase YuxK